jgi:hypothetical protein
LLNGNLHIDHSLTTMGHYLPALYFAYNEGAQ